MFNRHVRREQRELHEKAWKRSRLEPWIARWRQLSPAARLLFATETKSPARLETKSKLRARADLFPPAVQAELQSAGLVELLLRGGDRRQDSIVIPTPAIEFAHYVRSLYRWALLRGGRLEDYHAFLRTCFDKPGLLNRFVSVMAKQGVTVDWSETFVFRYLPTQVWVDAILSTLHDPLAQPVLDVLIGAEALPTVPELCARLPDHKPTAVVATVERLIADAVVVEDLRADSWEIVVGLFPDLREDLLRGNQPRERPPLAACESPSEIASEGGYLLDRMRALLLEIATDSPRLKQEGNLFQKENDRLNAVLPPIPDWLRADEPVASTPGDLIRWALFFSLVRREEREQHSRLTLSPLGERWLASSVGDQYAELYRTLNDTLKKKDHFFGISESARYFLGEEIAVKKTANRQRRYDDWWEMGVDNLRELREAFRLALGRLPSETFFTLDSVAEHVCFGSDNPILLGSDREHIRVLWRGREIPALEDELELVGAACLKALVRRRLIPFGALQAARDDQGKLCIARLPRLEAYFGKSLDPADLAGSAVASARVVVQPDFTIMILGLDPTPAAELVPFCERVRGHPGEGAMTLRITRDTVVRAVTNGLPASELIARLQRYSSNPVPENILHEVRDWSVWVREVPIEPRLLFRCADRDTADRTIAVLGQQAERLSETVVAYPKESLSSAVRKKLLKNGIVVKSKSDESEESDY